MGSHNCTARAANLATISALTIAHHQAIPKIAAAGTLKPCDSAGLGTFWKINKASFPARFLPCRVFACQGLWYQHSRPLEVKNSWRNSRGQFQSSSQQACSRWRHRCLHHSEKQLRSGQHSHTKFEETNLFPHVHLYILLSLCWHKIGNNSEKGSTTMWRNVWHIYHY